MLEMEKELCHVRCHHRRLVKEVCRLRLLAREACHHRWARVHSHIWQRHLPRAHLHRRTTVQFATRCSPVRTRCLYIDSKHMGIATLPSMVPILLTFPMGVLATPRARVSKVPRVLCTSHAAFVGTMVTFYVLHGAIVVTVPCLRAPLELPLLPDILQESQEFLVFYPPNRFHRVPLLQPYIHPRQLSP